MSNTEEETTCEGQQQDIGGGEMETDATKDVVETTSDEVEVKSEAGSESKETNVPEHPYKKELSEFRPHPWQMEKKDPEMYTSLEDTKLTLIDSTLLLEEMMLKLKEAKELAIDLEHHSYRSFSGMVCLVQISTRTEDFIIDALLLKDNLKVLNDVCTDSNILKVLHGSERDVEWLQKDFGVYVINMFDTQKAARTLQEEAVSMSHVLKKYCKVEINKEFQRADWRVRPLPDDMVKYAREDVHYLLYIHDVFRNALLNRGKDKALEEVYASCTTACGIMWYPEKHDFQPDSYLACYKRIKGKLNIQQLECFRLLYEWRHNLSLEKDESTGYTLPNKMMIKISKSLPRESKSLSSCCNPLPPFVQENLEDVQKLILQAIKNVPDVPEDASLVKKNSPKGNEYMRNLKRKKTYQASVCLACGRMGHQARECRISARGGMKQGRGRGGPWNRGPVPLYGSYHPGGSGMRGRAGFQNARGPRPMAAMRMHPYSVPPRGNLYHGMDGYNTGGYPFDSLFHQPGPRPFNAGHPRGMNYFY